MRRRFGLAVCTDGPDARGHARLATTTGGRTQMRHTAVIAAWRQVLVESGGIIPKKNEERMLRNTHIPVPPDDNW